MSFLHRIILAGSALLSAGGCYHYQPPESALEGTVFSEVNREESNRILAGTELLTLQIADRIAMKNNQSFIASLHAVNAAKMRYFQAYGAFVPQISASTSIGQDLRWNNNQVNPSMENLQGRNYATMSDTAVGASWLLFDGLAREFSLLIGKHEYDREEAVRARIMCMLRRAVAYAYDDMQLAAELEGIAERNRAFQLRLLGIVTPEEKRKLRPEDEVLNFRLLAGFAAASGIEAVYQREVADYALAQLMGYPEGVLPRTPGISPLDRRIRPLPFGIETALDLALANSPQMHIARQTLKIAEYNKYKSYSSFIPTFTAYSQFGFQAYGSRYQDYHYTRSSGNTPSFVYGIRADYTVFNGFARYNRMREMQAAFAMEQYQTAETYLQLVNDTRSAVANYHNHVRQAEIYRDVYETASRQRDLVEQRYLRRDASVDRLNKVQVDFVQTEIRYVTELNLLHKALAQLEAILCVPIFDDSQWHNPVEATMFAGGAERQADQKRGADQ